MLRLTTNSVGESVEEPKMSAQNQEPESEGLLVKVIGTLLGLAIIGAIAWGILYVRRGGSAPDTTLLLIVLGCIAVALIGPKVVHRMQSR
jgi:hypothetical protein